VGAGVAAAADLVAAAGQEVVDLVARDGVEPAAEGAAPRVVVQPADGAGHALQDLLHQVGSVGVLQAALAGEAVDQRRVHLDELPPGVLVARVAQADQQAGPGR
jgi:hypothetical protein